MSDETQMKNSSQKYYLAVYYCINCKSPTYLRVNFGDVMPVFGLLSDSKYETPICKKCGCKSWSHGKYFNND